MLCFIFADYNVFFTIFFRSGSNYRDKTPTNRNRNDSHGSVDSKDNFKYVQLFF